MKEPLLSDRILDDSFWNKVWAGLKKIKIFDVFIVIGGSIIGIVLVLALQYDVRHEQIRTFRVVGKQARNQLAASYEAARRNEYPDIATPGAYAFEVYLIDRLGTMYTDRSVRPETFEKLNDGDNVECEVFTDGYTSMYVNIIEK